MLYRQTDRKTRRDRQAHGNRAAALLVSTWHTRTVSIYCCFIKNCVEILGIRY